jgi:hypothetical protein
VSKKQKLIEKLFRGSIDGNELRTLMKQMNWCLDRTTSSHEIWAHEEKTLVLATHGKDLKKYQIREAQDKILGD